MICGLLDSAGQTPVFIAPIILLSAIKRIINYIIRKQHYVSLGNQVVLKISIILTNELGSKKLETLE
jgi:hypothetical protein